MMTGLSKGARFVRCCRQSGKLRWLHPWRYAIGGVLFKIPVALAVLALLCLGWIGERLAPLGVDAEYLADCWWDWHIGADSNRETALRIRAWRSRPATKKEAAR